MNLIELEDSIVDANVRTAGRDEESTSDTGIFCPSTDLPESTHVLAVRNQSGSLEFLPSLLPVPDVALLQLTEEDLFGRLRLVGKCIKARCSNWNGHCVLGWELSKVIRQVDSSSCAISRTCRWRIENGESVCGICPRVMRMGSLDDLLSEEM